jgi:ABC-type branched-subunit amino acid transport system ATPase component
LTQSALAWHACSWVQQVSSATVWHEDGKSGGKKVSPHAGPVLPDPELLLDPDEPEPPLDPELPLEVSAAAASLERDGVLLLEQPPESVVHAATNGTTT